MDVPVSSCPPSVLPSRLSLWAARPAVFGKVVITSGWHLPLPRFLLPSPEASAQVFLQVEEASLRLPRCWLCPGFPELSTHSSQHPAGVPWPMSSSTEIVSRLQASGANAQDVSASGFRAPGAVAGIQQTLNKCLRHTCNLIFPSESSVGV